MNKVRKKLIEVALPLPEINDASAYDKMPGIGPHPKGIHHWWARLPLPTARAVLFASVVTDPSDDPAWSDKSEQEQDAERERLFGIIRRMMGKKLHEHPEVYAEARAEMLKHCDGKLPPVLDPFAGGGSIPLEAARLGFEAHAADLNPVAVLLNKCNLELAPRWHNHPPVNPEDRAKIGGGEAWTGTRGLAADVRYYGRLIRQRAQEKIGHLYPKVRLPKEYGGGEANVIAWLWARTVASPEPSAKGAHVPVAATYMLSTKAGKLAWVQPECDDSALDGWRFSVRTGRANEQQVATARLGARAGKAQDFLCLLTHTPITREYIQSEGKAGRIRERLMAVVADLGKRKAYLSPSEAQEDIAKAATSPTLGDARASFLAGALPNRAGITGGVCSAYGLTTWGHLFTDRQLAALLVLSDFVKGAVSEIEGDGRKAGLTTDESRTYACAVSTFLALAVDRCADFNCALSTWKPSGQQQMHLFTRQALPMAWDFAEANLLSEKAICWQNAVEITADALEVLLLGATPLGVSSQTDAAADGITSSGLLVSTDPPYYNNIGYAVLSDFFYVWLRRAIGNHFPDVCSTVLVPKLPELTASPSRFEGDKMRAKEHFEAGFRKAFTHLREQLDERFPLTVYYAFKQEDDEGDGGSDHRETNSGVDLTTGWETLLEALVSGGFTITATWPVRASQKWRLVAMSSNALASYIVLACRPRPAEAQRTSRNAFVAELKRELPAALRHLQQGNIAPVDFAQAAIGPGMAVFSRYSAVLESNGKPMSVRTALALINGIKDELLGEAVEELDKDTRWAATWFAETGFDWGEAGKANLLANAQATAINGLVAAGIVEVKGNQVRLYHPEELPIDWDPATDNRLTVWEMTHHLIRVYVHEKKGDHATAEMLRKLGSKAEVARDLAYKLFTVCESKKRSQEAQAYNELVMGWPELAKLARDASRQPKPAQAELDI